MAYLYKFASKSNVASVQETLRIEARVDAGQIWLRSPRRWHTASKVSTTLSLGAPKTIMVAPAASPGRLGCTKIRVFSAKLPSRSSARKVFTNSPFDDRT